MCYGLVQSTTIRSVLTLPHSEACVWPGFKPKVSWLGPLYQWPISLSHGVTEFCIQMFCILPTLVRRSCANFFASDCQLFLEPNNPCRIIRGGLLSSNFSRGTYSAWLSLTVELKQASKNVKWMRNLEIHSISFRLLCCNVALLFCADSSTPTTCWGFYYWLHNFGGAVTKWLERSPLVLKIPDLKHSLCTGFFRNFLCSPRM